MDPDSTDPTIIANFRLPAFSPVDTAIWFRRAEVQFRIKNVKSPTSQADHVLAALPDTIFPQLAEWLDSHGADPIKYQDLKAFLLKKFSLSPEQRVKCILDLVQQPLGDQRPSDALTELRSLARLPPDGSGTQQSIDVLLALWLHRLPEKVRARITNFNSYDNDQDIAAKADSILDTLNAASKASITALADVPSDEQQDEEKCTDAVAQTSSYPRQRRFNKSPASSTSLNFKKTPQPPKTAAQSNRFCYYHSRFADKAQKCQPPCAWKKI